MTRKRLGNPSGPRFGQVSVYADKKVPGGRRTPKRIVKGPVEYADHWKCVHVPILVQVIRPYVTHDEGRRKAREKYKKREIKTNQA
jgi:hypothetical protein